MFSVVLEKHNVPLENGRGPSFKETCIFITQECFVPNSIEIGPVVPEK